MENKKSTKDRKVENQVTDKLTKEIKTVTDGQNPDKQVAYEQMENDLNSKILKITMLIKDQYPELSQYLEEMPVTVPSENDPEISLNQLKSYYESLNSLLIGFNYEPDTYNTEGLEKTDAGEEEVEEKIEDGKQESAEK
jgi:hypothetical protein